MQTPAASGTPGKTGKKWEKLGKKWEKLGMREEPGRHQDTGMSLDPKDFPQFLKFFGMGRSIPGISRSLRGCRGWGLENSQKNRNSWPGNGPKIPGVAPKFWGGLDLLLRDEIPEIPEVFAGNGESWELESSTGEGFRQCPPEQSPEQLRRSRTFPPFSASLPQSPQQLQLQ